MAISASDITDMINKAQQKIAILVDEIIDRENNGEDATPRWLKVRYLSAGVLNLSANNTLTDDEKEMIVQCMQKAGDLGQLAVNSALVFPTIYVQPAPLYPQKWTDLTDTSASYPGVGYIPMVRAGNNGLVLIKHGYRNTAIVSGSGNDSLAEINNAVAHFKTITAAEAAVSLGDTILIYPGNYVDTGLGKNGVTYHYMPGAVHSAATAIFDTSTSDIGFDVTGYGEFIGTDDVFVLGEGNVNLTDNRIYHIQAKSITCSGSSNVGLYLKGGRHFLDVDEVILGYVYAQGILTENLIEVYGSIRKMHPTTTSNQIGTSLCILGGDTGSIINLEFDYLTKDDHPITSIALFDIGNHGDTYISFNKCNFGGTNYSGSSAVYVWGNGNVTIKGDITSAAQHGIEMDGGGVTTPTVHYNGKITTGTVAAVKLDIAGATLTLEGEFTTTGAQAIDLDDGTLRIRNARIESTYANAAGHSITKDGGTLVLEDAYLVQTHASANGINAGTAQNVITKDAVSKQAHHSNVTEQGRNTTIDSNYV